jgi:Ca2+/Na+ antiporter
MILFYVLYVCLIVKGQLDCGAAELGETDYLRLNKDKEGDLVESDIELSRPPPPVVKAEISDNDKITPSVDHLRPGAMNTSEWCAQSEAEIFSQKYWYDCLCRRRCQQQLISEEWWSLPWYHKFRVALESPFTIARDWSIPTCDKKLWSKKCAILQPIVASQVLLCAFGMTGEQHHSVSAPLVALLVALVPSALIYCLADAENPPQSPIFALSWGFSSFTMCVCWIYLLAGELVTVLTVVGISFNIPAGMLGLTILAWGNSVGDLVANTAVARDGLERMAMTGCYAGPAFNLLVGCGVSFTVSCASLYPKPFPIHFDDSAIISLSFLLCHLPITLAIVHFRGYLVDSFLALYLFAVYFIYSIVQIEVFMNKEVN